MQFSKALDPVKFKSFALSHQGYHRTHNEDAYLEQIEMGIFVIADGIGSLENGEWASQVLVQPFNINKSHYSFNDRVYAFKRELLRRHQYLFYGQQGRSVGATLVALMMDKEKAMILWAGDARAYCFYQRTHQLIQLTEDHTYQKAITRAAGVEEKLLLDEKFLNLQGDEIFLLCSDGLNKGASLDELKFFLAQNLPLSSACKKLIDFSLMRGSQDNITVLLVEQC